MSLVVIRWILLQLMLFLLRLFFIHFVHNFQFVCRLLRNVLSSHNGCRVYSFPGIYVLHSSLVRYRTDKLCSLLLCFGLVPNLSSFWISFSFISFSRFEMSASCILFSRFFFSYLFLSYKMFCLGRVSLLSSICLGVLYP